VQLWKEQAESFVSAEKNLVPMSSFFCFFLFFPFFFFLPSALQYYSFWSNLMHQLPTGDEISVKMMQHNWLGGD